MITTTRQNQNRRGGRLLLIGIAVLIAGLFALPTTVEAHGKHDRGRGDHAQRYKKGYGIHRNHRGFGRVPHRISARHRHDYGRFYRGRVYYKRHRHHHALYRFPIFVDGRLVYRNYAYCGDALFLSAGVRLPRLALDLAFGGPDGFYLRGIYRNP